jgi:hypothetical protein
MKRFCTDEQIGAIRANLFEGRAPAAGTSYRSYFIAIVSYLLFCDYDRGKTVFGDG